MSEHQSEEPDPLLSFFIESPAPDPPPAPAEPGTQPAHAETFPPSPPGSPIQVHADIERVDRIEQALDQSKQEILALTSQVATLVGAIADMNKRMSRPVTPRVPVRLVMSRTLRRTVSALAAVLVIIGAGVVSWLYWPSGAATIRAPIEQVEAATPVAPEPLIASPPAAPAAKVVTPRRVSEPAAPVVKTAKYVGTLSIDSAPGGDVFVDRKTAGRTPLRVANLRAGSHLIWIEREGYRRWTRVVTVSADRVSRVTADLEPIAPR